MTNERTNEIEGKMELGHKPVPPFRTVFWVTLTIGVLYLGLIFYMTL
jgi:hypothetical protein